MNIVTVYSRPGCGKCEQTKKQFEKHGVPYIEIDVSQSKKAEDTLRERGMMTLPVVAVDHGKQIEWWDDFRIDKIRGIIAIHKNEKENRSDNYGQS